MDYIKKFFEPSLENIFSLYMNYFDKLPDKELDENSEDEQSVELLYDEENDEENDDHFYFTEEEQSNEQFTEYSEDDEDTKEDFRGSFDSMSEESYYYFDKCGCKIFAQPLYDREEHTISQKCLFHKNFDNKEWQTNFFNSEINKMKNTLLALKATLKRTNLKLSNDLIIYKIIPRFFDHQVKLKDCWFHQCKKTHDTNK